MKGDDFSLRKDCLVCLLVLTAEIIKLAFFPVDINEYENRYAEQLPSYTLESWLDGSFQDGIETALSDQLPAAMKAKEAYNNVFTAYNTWVLQAVMDYAGKESKETADMQEGVLEVGEDSVQTIKDSSVFYWTLPDSNRQVLAGHLMSANRFLAREQEKLDIRIQNINSTVSAHPELMFYLYYIEKETDVNFVTGESSGIFEYLHDNVSTISEENKRRFHILSFDDFDSQFYRTDHHWNNQGSYLAYTQILAWLLPGERPLVPLAEYELGSFAGSKTANSSAPGYIDTFRAYEFGYPDMTVIQNSKPVSDYGSQSKCITMVRETGNPLDYVSYGTFYGDDAGEVVFHNKTSKNGSILIIGESYDNALLKLLASHFTDLYSIDLRNYEAQIGDAFSLQQYLNKHSDIGRILLIGNLDYYVLDSFNIAP